ncbi:non-ribosomal peptide synthetase, partial [Clostridium tagluense]|uniref:non-ribosomal peptide synthetase n=1 Tax=Clostridium tagluense TaxID=360422 RepID=UPI001CF3292B
MDKQLQNIMAFNNKFKNEKEYWEKRLSGDIEIASFSNNSSNIYTYDRKINTLNFKLSNEVFNRVLSVSNNSQYGIYMILLSGVNYILHSYSRCSDVIIGVPKIKDNINKTNYNKIIPLRTYINEEYTFKEFLIKTTKDVKELYQFANFPLDKVVEQLESGNLADLNDLLKTIVLLSNIHEEKSLENTDGDILFCFNFKDGYLELNLEYNFNLFSEEYIEQIVQCLFCYLENVMKNPNVKLLDIEILNEEEKRKLLYEFNNTYADYPKDKTIHELFEEQVERTPDNIAVVFEDTQLTYRELNAKSNQLAGLLRSKGVQADSIVGIMVERSFEMIIGIMGILKAGGAYLPIDPNYPQDRKKYMLENSNAKILLIQEHFMEIVSYEGEIINLDDEGIYKNSVQNMDNISGANKLAYVIYTSGSTGKPKGVMIEHKSIINRLNWMQKKYPLAEEDVILQKTTYAFDVSVWELLWWSLVGAKVKMLPQGAEKDPTIILENIKSEKVTVIHFVPSMLSVFMEHVLSDDCYDDISTLRYVFASGEVLKKEHSDIFNEMIKDRNNIELVNLYGPTEAAVDVTYYDCKSESYTGIIPIGKPIDNISIYVVDKAHKMIPVGVAGELCISGVGLARGYLNNLELTAEKFVENPFVSGDKMYKTGDLARWLADGNIEFIGRIDHQVKIRGFRIELGEIESQLLAHELVKEAVVIDKEDEDGNKYLCAYIVSEEELKVSELREHLSRTLPEYMVPSCFIQIEKMMLTPNGKVDRKALLELDGTIKTGVEYEAPRNEVEAKLVRVWEEVLGVDKIGINDNFFELGGHSLKATVLVSRIHKELDVEVSLREVFKKPTIKGISEYIEKTEKSIYSIIEPVEEKEHYEASSAQKRIYMLQQFDLKSTAYNMPSVMEIEGRLDKQRLESAIEKLIERHESLRTSFKTIDGEIVQRVNKDIGFRVDYLEKSDKNRDEIIKEFIRSFDLNKAPLLRVGLIKLEEDKHILMFDMHHIISDGVSSGILIKEFVKLYEEKELASLRIQYKDYSHWQNKLLKSEVMKIQEDYWINIFKDEVSILNMPTDYSRPAIQSFEGD